MARADSEVIEHVAGGGTLGADDTLSPGYKGELMRLMAVFVDSELAGAAGFVPFINSAPGLKQRSIAARIVSEKYRHAEQGLSLMEPFGINPELYVRSHCWWSRLDRSLDLGARRVGSDKRLNVFHYPLEGWTDAVVLNLLMGTASAVQIDELAGSSYRPMAEVMGAIASREKTHAEWGEEGLRQEVERLRDHRTPQVNVDYWFPRVAATFGRHGATDQSQQYLKYGLRQATSGELLNRWLVDIGPRLKGLGLTLPPVPTA
ncbi:Phenylacetic acid catabolic protein [Caenispirillum salinarum AK4]|uniref:Phenylacetic acid catabolic protein n=1 Tax=Caenispirillum salinarum AK4 TaxID=1238182 RepID=K9HK50_9PROT|nr:Phenylacetic acid catabolic protein [Caenispirillum salinarum]EKV30713.1 Phenylacetic acid catabolic protein [Caenispirillum salinarum AK4]